MQILDTPDGHGEFVLRQRELQQRPRRHDRKLWHFLIKISQRWQGMRRGLDFIQKQERISRGDLASEQSLDLANNPHHIQTPKNGIQGGMSFQINLQKLQSYCLGKLAHQGGFPNLPRPS